METKLLAARDFDDRFALEILFRKDSPSPLRTRIVFSTADIEERSFELPVDALTELLSEALGKTSTLLLEELRSSLPSAFGAS